MYDGLPDDDDFSLFFSLLLVVHRLLAAWIDLELVQSQNQKQINEKPRC